MGFFHLLSKWTWRAHLQIIQIPDHSASGTHQEEHMPQKCAGLKDPVWSATFKWTDNKMQLGCPQSACNKKSTKGIAKDHPMKVFCGSWPIQHGRTKETIPLLMGVWSIPVYCKRDNYGPHCKRTSENPQVTTVSQYNSLHIKCSRPFFGCPKNKNNCLFKILAIS